MLWHGKAFDGEITQLFQTHIFQKHVLSIDYVPGALPGSAPSVTSKSSQSSTPRGLPL